MPALVPDVNVHPQENATYRSGRTWMNQDDDVVISGFSGRLPESNSIEEFKQNLYDGVDMVTDDERRWPSGMYELKSLFTVTKGSKSIDFLFSPHGKLLAKWLQL